MTGEQRGLIHLGLVGDMGPTASTVLINACARARLSLTGLYSCSAADLVNFGLTPKSAQAVATGLANEQMLDQELELIEKTGTRVIFYNDPEYPDLLKTIYMAPVLLYVRGTLACLCERNLAIVGSRAGTPYGRAFIDDIVPELAVKKWSIISGGARGIDAMAHESALVNRTSTVAVMGSGLLVPYPAGHKELFERVVDQGGALITPFSMNTQPQQWHFPARNRIIAGMSRGVVVVQAATKSGALITARFALEYGREVFAVPGAFNDPLSDGCHELIKQGAVLVTSSDDVLSELDPQHKKSATKPMGQKTGASKKIRAGVTPLIGKSEPVQLAIAPEPRELTVAERIITLCRAGAGVDDLVAALGVPVGQVHEELFALQLSGSIKQDFTGRFRA